MARVGTESSWYARRLSREQNKRWKRLLHAQAPYHWNIRRQQLGRTLDVGCGIGRNLGALVQGSLGVDHNSESVAMARAQGHEAITVEEFRAAPPAPESFDGLLVSHVIEHLDAKTGDDLLKEYLAYIRPGGRVFLICPQERGFASDETHVRWTTLEDLEHMARSSGLVPIAARSFPLPRAFGRVFTHNEFNLLAIKP